MSWSFVRWNTKTCHGGDATLCNCACAANKLSRCYFKSFVLPFVKKLNDIVKFETRFELISFLKIKGANELKIKPILIPQPQQPVSPPPQPEPKSFR